MCVLFTHVHLVGYAHTQTRIDQRPSWPFPSFGIPSINSAASRYTSCAESRQNPKLRVNFAVGAEFGHNSHNSELGQTRTHVLVDLWPAFGQN